MHPKTAVVKLGSSSVTRNEGPDPVLFARTMQSIGRANAAGWEVVLVSSGAAALGSVLLRNSSQRGRDVGSTSRHLRSAVGQPELMSLYRFLGDTCGIDTCQVLLSANDLQDPERMQRVAHLIREALDAGRLPILNGNDSTDANVYDNDSLAASIAIASRANHLLMLSDVPGVLSEEGVVYAELHPQDANKVPVLGDSSAGTGGITSKIRSASLAALNGVRVTIAQADETDVIERVLGGEAIGTSFLAQRPPKQTHRALWIGGIAAVSGRLVVNLEAEESIANGASLFGSGVKRVSGSFGRGSVVKIEDQSRRLIGRGTIRVSSDLLALAHAMQPAETVKLYLWLLTRLGATEGGGAALNAPSERRAARAIASAEDLSDERVGELGREVLQMFPAVGAAPLVGKNPVRIEQDLLAATQRFSLIDNRSLVVFRTR